MKKNFLLIYALVLCNLSTAILVMAADLGLLTDWTNILIIGLMTLAGYAGTILACVGYRERLTNPDVAEPRAEDYWDGDETDKISY